MTLVDSTTPASSPLFPLLYIFLHWIHYFMDAFLECVHETNCFIHPQVCQKICLVYQTYGRHVWSHCGNFYLTSIWNFFLKLVSSWRGLKWVKVSSVSTWCSSWACTCKWWIRSCISISAFVLDKLPLAWPPLQGIFNGSGVPYDISRMLFAFFYSYHGQKFV